MHESCEQSPVFAKENDGGEMLDATLQKGPPEQIEFGLSCVQLTLAKKSVDNNVFESRANSNTRNVDI